MPPTLCFLLLTALHNIDTLTQTGAPSHISAENADYHSLVVLVATNPQRSLLSFFLLFFAFLSFRSFSPSLLLLFTPSIQQRDITLQNSLSFPHSAIPSFLHQSPFMHQHLRNPTLICLSTRPTSLTTEPEQCLNNPTTAIQRGIDTAHQVRTISFSYSFSLYTKVFFVDGFKDSDYRQLSRIKGILRGCSKSS